jgi:hypothetical protein
MECSVVNANPRAELTVASEGQVMLTEAAVGGAVGTAVGAAVAGALVVTDGGVVVEPPQAASASAARATAKMGKTGWSLSVVAAV